MIIGLTGGIASGKTMVSRYLEDKGYTVIDADLLSRQAAAAGSPAMHEVTRVFGPDYLNADGSLDRRRMADRVFTDPDARDRLNAIMHPAIYDLAAQRIGQIGPDQIAFLVVPLLYEAGFDRLCDRVWTVICDPQVRLARLMDRDGLTLDQARARLASQMSDADRLRRYPTVIRNDGDQAARYAQVDQALAKLSASKNNA